MIRVAIIGASGFVGSTLVERLLAHGDVEVRPIIHSSGSAARLARLGIPLQSADVLAKDTLGAALEGCTHVVNCARGSSDVMIRGLRNLLDVCRNLNVTKFVHLSSAAVYGEVFPGEPVREDYASSPVRNSYGWKKLQQDKLVRGAARRGLPSVVLCPPNVSGPYSTFLVEVVEAMRCGTFAVVDEGRMPCELVDVANLAHAIMLALTCHVADGRRIFVTNLGLTTWRDVMDSLATLVDDRANPISLAANEAGRLVRVNGVPRASAARTMRHLLSSDVRSVLTKDPALAALERFARSIAGVAPERTLAWLKTQANHEGREAKVSLGPSFNVRLLSQQLRNARFSCQEAYQNLGYDPAVSFAESQRAFVAWYRACFGVGCPDWDLLRLLY